jgi:hypothetical protein
MPNRYSPPAPLSREEALATLEIPPDKYDLNFCLTSIPLGPPLEAEGHDVRLEPFVVGLVPPLFSWVVRLKLLLPCIVAQCPRQKSL